MFGDKFIVLNATIFKADAHIETNAGLLTYDRLRSLYNRDEGFGIQFHGTDKRLTLSWKSIVDCAEDLLFFGPPLNGVQRYHNRFKDITKIQYIHKMYYTLTRETVGDHIFSSDLAISYKSRVVNVFTGQLAKASIEAPPSAKEAELCSFDKDLACKCIPFQLESDLYFMWKM